MGDNSDQLELAVSRIGVLRSIRLYQIYAGNGTLQRWFSVAPAPEQEIGCHVASPGSKSCCLALMLSTSDAKVLVASRTSTPAILSPTLLSPRSIVSDGHHTYVRTSAEEGQLLQSPEIDLHKYNLMTDTALLKRSLERKPKGKVWFESPAVIALTLNENFDEISASQDSRRLFQDALADNVASALSLARRQILVFGLRRGSVIATIGIIVPGGGPSTQELADLLQQQMEVFSFFPTLPAPRSKCSYEHTLMIIGPVS